MWVNSPLVEASNAEAHRRIAELKAAADDQAPT
jgi:hypothetical protein